MKKVACAGGCDKIRDGGEGKWLCEECNVVYKLIECSECEEVKPVEKGTWALYLGMCETCHCIFEGG